jgi:hypothetical protein
MIEFPEVLAFREIFSHLRRGFERKWAYISAVVLLSILDPVAFVAIIWFFFFSHGYPIRPVILEIMSAVYLILTVILGIIAFQLGTHRSVRATSILYLSIGIFFLMKGTLDRSGRDFSVWPWIIVWVAILVVVLTNFAREQSELKENPQD